MSPIMPRAEEALVTSNGAEDVSIWVDDNDEMLASSSESCNHGSASASSSPSNEPSPGGTACSGPQPTTTTVSGSNTTTSTTSGNDADIQMERPQEDNDAEIPRDGLRRRPGVLNTQSAGPRGSNDDEIQREGLQDRNHADDGLFKLGEIFMGLSFQLGIALMIVRVQPMQGDSSTNLSSLSSILFNTVGGTTFFCFVFTMLGWLLREHHLEKAKFCTWIGIWSGVLVFFLMISIFTTA